MTKLQSFSIQNPEWYNSIYGNKDYRSEAKHFLKIFNTNFKNKPYIVDVGSGTGNLIPFLQPYSSKYLGSGFHKCSKMAQKSVKYWIIVKKLRKEKINENEI